MNEWWSVAVPVLWVSKQNTEYQNTKKLIFILKDTPRTAVVSYQNNFKIVNDSLELVVQALCSDEIPVQYTVRCRRGHIRSQAGREDEWHKTRKWDVHLSYATFPLIPPSVWVSHRCLLILFILWRAVMAFQCLSVRWHSCISKHHGFCGVLVSRWPQH